MLCSFVIDSLNNVLCYFVIDSATSLMTDGIRIGAAKDVTPVVSAYEHALFAKHPHHKYLPGVDSKIFFFLKNYCPDVILDTIIMKIFLYVVPDVLLKRRS